MANELEILKRKIAREKAARIEAESLLEEKSLALFHSNQELKKINERLEDIVDERTERLKSSQEEYYMLVNNISDLICKTSLGADVTFINPMTAQTLGFTKMEIIGSSIFDFIDPKMLNRIKIRAFRHFLGGDCIFYTEVPVVTKNKELIWLGLDVNFYSDKCCDCIRKHRYLLGKSATVKSKNCHFKEVIIVARNITEQKYTQELLEEQKIQLARNLNQQTILSNTAVELNSLRDFNDKMNNTLLMVGKHLNVSRVYIFEDNDQGTHTTNTFEWCNQGIEPQIENLVDIPYSYIPSWKEMLVEKGIVYSENIHELPDDIIAILEPQGIHSIIVLPIIIQKQQFGFMGFDECESNRKWGLSEIELLRTIVNIISNAFHREKVERELIKSEQENSAIINSIPDFIFHHNKNGYLFSYKSADEGNLPFNPSKMRSQNIKELFNSDFSDKITVAINECVANGSFQFEFRYKYRKQNYHLETRLRKINDDEVLSIIRDVSKGKEYEEQLTIAKEKAEQASRAKSEFLANVSHELRTPMNAIIGFSEVLMEKITEPVFKKQIQTIHSSGRTLLSLINDILDLSRIEAGKMLIDMEPMQLDAVFIELKQVFEHKSQKKNLAFSVQVDEKIPNFILMDEVRFYQILHNLAGNAIKYTEKGFVKVSAYGEHRNSNDFDLIIEVQDTGIGIPEGQQTMIFDAFTQQSGQTNRKYEGTGLGLSITRKLVEKFNGNIELKSKVGEGSIFKVTLPKIKIINDFTKSESIDVTINEDILFEPSVILVVDDINYNIELIKSMIDNESIQIDGVNSGEDALNYLQYQKPDIILMDLRMHGISGYNATEIIKSNDKFKEIPIIAFTDSILDVDAENKIVKFDGVLSKPVSRKQLFEILKNFLNFTIKEETNNKKEKVSSNKLIPSLSKNEINKINMTLMPEWEKVKDDLIVFEIEGFVEKMKEFCIEHKIKGLEGYVDVLSNSLKTFDIDSIEQNLNYFPQLIEKITDKNK